MAIASQSSGSCSNPGTDDVRNFRAISLVRALQAHDVRVVAYDPVVTENMRPHFPDIEYADNAAAALEDARAAFVVTDWDEFAALNTAFDAMATPLVVDGRRIIQRRDGTTRKDFTW